MTGEFIYSVLLKPRPLRSAANAVLRALLPQVVVREGATIHLNPADPVISGALMLNIYERLETAFFLSVCMPGSVFLDVGANCGYYTGLFLSRADRHSRVVALEPDPQCFPFLKRTAAANGATEATCLQVAAADASGTACLYRNDDNRGDNRLYRNDLATSSCLVQVTTADNILDELNILEANLVKIDVQGYEASVLRGMRRVIERTSRMIILTEFWPSGLEQAGDNPVAMLDFLSANGFAVFHLNRYSRLVRIADRSAFIRGYPGRRYTNIVAMKGVDSRPWMQPDA
jgi:FkbM family methyltransferase